MEYTVEQKKQIKKKIRTLTFFWLGLFIELVIAIAIFYLVLAPRELMPTNNLADQYWLYFSYFSVIISIPLSYYIYNRISKSNNETLNPIQKYEKYQMSMIIKYTMYEFAGIFSLIVFCVTQRLEPLSMFAMILVIVAINKPSAYIFRKDYNLMLEEDLFINPDYKKEEIKNEQNKIKTKNKD